MIVLESPQPLVRLPRYSFSGGPLCLGARVLPEETAIGFTYNGSSHAVMMGTPADLQDFAIGFSLSEGVIDDPQEIVELDVLESDLGIEVRMWLAEPRSIRYVQRRRLLAGPVGCGLCGLESLAEAARPVQVVTGRLQLSPHAIASAMSALSAAQPMNRQASALHAAAFWQPRTGLVAAREDVGRHNALDKLAGALARNRIVGNEGAVLLTSRVSVEMVQKTARIGAPVLVAVSAPTALAVRTAAACGITLIAIARGDAFEVFTHSERLAEHEKFVEPIFSMR